MSLVPRPKPVGDTGTEEDPKALVASIRTLAVAEVGRRGILLRLTKLPPDLTKPHHLRLIRTALEPLMGADRARIFRLQDENLVVIWRGESAAFLAQTLHALELLFADFGGEGTPTTLKLDDMITQLDLPQDSHIVLKAVEESIQREAPRRARPANAPALLPLTVAALDLLERSLAQADVGRFARRRPVCTVSANRAMRQHWEKRYLTITELVGTLMPAYSPQADPWLFRRLTRTLERRMLTLLSDPDELRMVRPFSLGLNVSGILSPEFLKFDSTVPSSLRGELILALQPVDVLGDVAAFCFARNFARERGYRLLLRGLTPELLPVFQRERLGVDLLQLRWSPDMAAMKLQVLQEAAGDLQQVVLGGVEEIEALTWGLAAGIGYFQGGLIQPSVPDSLPARVKR